MVNSVVTKSVSQFVTYRSFQMELESVTSTASSTRVQDAYKKRHNINRIMVFLNILLVFVY